MATTMASTTTTTRLVSQLWLWLWCCFLLLEPVDSFASYLLSDSGCRVYLETEEVIMNHPVQEAVVDAPLYIELVADTTNAASSIFQFQKDHVNEPTQHETVVLDDVGNSNVVFPFSFQVRVSPISSNKLSPSIADYQFILQLGEESDATFTSGACEGSKRVGGRSTDMYTVALNKPSVVELWGAWAAGHEPVKLLQGYRFVMKSSSSNSSSDQQHDNTKSEEEIPQQQEGEDTDSGRLGNNEQTMSWEYYVLQDEASCQDDAHGIVIPNHVREVQDAQQHSSSLPTELVVVEEEEPSQPDAATVLKLGWSDGSKAFANELGHMLLHVSTSNGQPGEEATVHPAKFSSSHAVCEGKRLLLPHVNDFPLALEIPHQPHANHVVVAVHAVFDLHKDHDDPKALLYRIKPLELHWTKDNSNNSNEGSGKGDDSAALDDKKEKKMSWEFHALQTCDVTHTEGITIPEHIKPIQAATPPLPIELVVTEEKELQSPDSPSVLKIGWPKEGASTDRLGHVLLHVITSDASDAASNNNDNKPIHPAKFTHSHTVCNSQRLLLPHLNDFPLTLEIPHQPHSDHVLVVIHAVYDLLEEHEKEDATLYKIKPLELHWKPPSPGNNNEANELKKIAEQQLDDLKHRESEMAEAAKRHIQESMDRHRKHSEQQKNAAVGEDSQKQLDEERRKRFESDRNQREKKAEQAGKLLNDKENPDPQRSLDESIQLDLRQHLKELQDKQEQKKRRAGEAVGGASRGRLDDPLEEMKRHAYRHKHKEQAGITDDSRGRTRKRMRRDYGQGKKMDQNKKQHRRRKDSNRDDRAGDDDEYDLNAVPLVLWQDSSYFIGLVILVGGIYGSIAVCLFLSKVLSEKDRQE